MNGDDFWAPAAGEITLPRDEVHVWRAPAEIPDAETARLLPTLSDDERRRADAYSRPELRKAFVVARGLLRALLGHYLRMEPGDIVFTYNAHGRPELPVHTGRPALHFNLSHSGGVVLYGFAWQRQLGIDVEQVGRRLEFESLARRFFSARESDQLMAIDESERRAAFFLCWTRKEAFIKATGRGLSYGLGRFDVTLAPGEPARLLRAQSDDAARWSLRDLPAGADYAAALAVEERAIGLRGWQWNADHWRASRVYGG